MSKYSRRRFLQNAVLTATTAVASGSVFKSYGTEHEIRSKGPNEKLGMLVIGVNGRGKYHLEALGHLQNECDIVAICDADQAVGENAAMKLRKIQEFKGRGIIKTFAKRLRIQRLTV